MLTLYCFVSLSYTFQGQATSVTTNKTVKFWLFVLLLGKISDF